MMLESIGTRLGNFDFSTRLLEEQEKKFYGIFISHSSADDEKYLRPLCKAMQEHSLYPLCDRDFLKHGDNYHVKIENALDCYAAVIIITKNSIYSDWVSYEMGFLSGEGLSVFLWDPENILQTSVELKGFVQAHFNHFMPAYTDMEQLVQTVCNLSPYSDMFCEENAFLDCKTFRDRMNRYATTVIATLESDVIDEYYNDFADCNIGTLIPNFGMFYPNHGDGVNCFARSRCTPLENGVCPQNKLACALSLPRTLGEENKECVLLNHVMYNGHVLRKGEKDRRGRIVEKGCLIFHLPVHRLYGTEFKFILDVPDNERFDSLMSVLEKAGMNPSSSDSMLGGRIYLSLPERRGQGLFRLKHEFENNFLCPHATRTGSF